MTFRFAFSLTVALACSVTAPAQKKPAAPKAYRPGAEELEQIRDRTARLASILQSLSARHADDGLLTDVEIYHKAAVWIVRYADEEFFAKRYVADTLAALDRGLLRAKQLSEGRAEWPSQKGQLVRAYRSRVDGSVQPYGLAIPESYDARKPVRLDVVLHGRGAALNEISFLTAHDSSKPLPPGQDYIRLDVYGRWNNAYRWAGETDVFEAIASVRQRYKIDPRRIVLRGFSMGGAGAWHLGLHYPDRWAAVEAGAGFTETKRYAKLDTLPAYQEATLHIYDAADYALNAGNVPIVGYGGEQDAQLQATLNIRQQLVDQGFHFRPDGLNSIGEDLTAIFLVGPKTGHKFHPQSHEQSERFIQTALDRPAAAPDHLRFVTYTTRYNRCFWLTVAALQEHYQRAEVDARRSPDGRSLAITTRNVARLVLAGQPQDVRLTVDGREVAVQRASIAAPRELVLDKTAGGWIVAASGSPSLRRKRHGLQGPIDDAFCDAFLCVRPSGKPQHDLPAAYTSSVFDRFQREFAKWMRAEVRVKLDREVTPADIAAHHLVLFGDPASNQVLSQIAGRLPIRWTAEAIQVGGRRFPATDHVLAMIYPNPLNPARYVVLNSGHTFHEKDFRGTNALLFPRLGDYAVMRLAPGTGAGGDAEVATAGLFGEHWELPGTGKGQ